MNDKMIAIKAKIQEANQIADKLVTSNKKIKGTAVTKIANDLNQLIEDMESKLKEKPNQKAA